jgi:4-hydroxybenzoyl-CoA thioesterase
MLINRRKLRIEWGQCDPAGIVFYPQYFVMFDISTALLFERSGLTPRGMREKYGIVGLPLVNCGAKFSAPCSFDDDVEIESGVAEWGRTSFVIRHRILKGEIVAIEGHEKRIWAAMHEDKPGRIKPVPVPAEIVAALSAKS